MTTIREFLTEHGIDVDQEILGWKLDWWQPTGASRVDRGGIVIAEPTSPALMEIQLTVQDERGGGA